MLNQVLRLVMVVILRQGVKTVMNKGMNSLSQRGSNRKGQGADFNNRNSIDNDPDQNHEFDSIPSDSRMDRRRMRMMKRGGRL